MTNFIKFENMNFWKNVDSELEYLGKTRKDLATTVGFDVSTIAKGIAAKSVPSADTALKVAQFLNVSIEYLLTGDQAKILRGESPEYKKFKIYRRIINALDKLPSKTKDLICAIILELEKGL